MRKASLFFIAIGMILCGSALGAGGTTTVEPIPVPKEESIKDPVARLDAQIKYLEQKKIEMQELSRYLGREAERILFDDFVAYRSYVLRQKQTDVKIAHVEEQIAELKAQRASLSPASK
jgi:cell division protein FtsN